MQCSCLIKIEHDLRNICKIVYLNSLIVCINVLDEANPSFILNERSLVNHILTYLAYNCDLLHAFLMDTLAVF